MEKEKDNAEFLALWALGAYRDLRPASWRHRPRRLLDGGPDARWGTRPRMSVIDGKVSASPRPTMQHVYPHEGAQWLLLENVVAAIKHERNLSTFVPLKVKYALIDERREETQGGLWGRHEGVNRGPKTVGLTAFDVSPPDADNGDFPLVRASPDPMVEAARMQLIESVQAAGQFSKPTQRKHLRAGPSPSDFLVESSYWREPAGGVYLNPWHYRPGGHARPALPGWWDVYPPVPDVWTAERIAAEYPNGYACAPAARDWKPGAGWAASAGG
jgi:hypothetical protein